MADFATQDLLNSAPLDATYSACNIGGDTFVNDNETLLHFKNTNASPRNVTVGAAGKYKGATITAKVYTVPATDEVFVKPYAAEITQDPTTGKTALSYDAVTGLTAAVVRFKAG